MDKKDFLATLHTHLTPRTFLEVGTETVASLALVGCDVIAVDPQFQLDVSATGDRSRTCHQRSLILLHDRVPLNPRMALRQWLPGDPSET